MSEIKKPPLPKLFLPLEFWAEKMLAIDRKIEAICSKYEYGDVTVSFVIRNHTLVDTIYTDNVRVREALPKRDVVDNIK